MATAMSTTMTGNNASFYKMPLSFKLNTLRQLMLLYSLAVLQLPKHLPNAATAFSLVCPSLPLRFVRSYQHIQMSLSITTAAPEPSVDAFQLVRSLVQNLKCYTTSAGAKAFGAACADDVVYEDCSEGGNSRPIVGRKAVTQHMLRKVAQRRGKGDLRLDKISDGTSACGFAWTYTCGREEGLRGTTFVQLDSNLHQIVFVREVPEPILKPGASMMKLLYWMAKDKHRTPVPYHKKTPTSASQIARYLFDYVQWSDIDECKRFFDDNIFCRDFNYAEAVSGKEEVAEFTRVFEDLPGINFRGQHYDNGVLSTCYVWEVDLQGSPEPLKGISFHELNPDTKKIVYMRDLSAATIFPPVLGKLAKWLRPGLGVFRGVQLGSRLEGK